MDKGKETFESIREKGLLLYEFVRGSVSQGCNIEGVSDTDTGGVFMCPTNQLLDLGYNYQDQIADEKNDNVWYELKKFLNLLLKSNPTMLECLFVDDEFVLYEHPIMTEIKKHRDIFLTKECFKPIYGFCKSQIEKMRGLNKKIVNPITERLGPLDFAYTFYKQGSSKILNWLEYRALNQKYCGLVNIPNMEGVYGVYYDWGNHFLNEGVTIEDLLNAYNDDVVYDTINIVKRIKAGENGLEETLKKAQFKNMVNFIVDFYQLLDERMGLTDIMLRQWYEAQKPIGYKGMVGEDKLSNELRLSSVSKGEKPICYISYNKNGYSSHCVDYKNYKDWEKYRNPKRYESNLEKNYDSKNAMHCLRLMQMCIEVARGEGFKINRRNIDRDFLIDVRNHKFEYDEIKEIMLKKDEEMMKAIEISTIPETIDREFVNNLLLNIRYQNLS